MITQLPRNSTNSLKTVTSFLYEFKTLGLVRVILPGQYFLKSIISPLRMNVLLFSSRDGSGQKMYTGQPGP